MAKGNAADVAGADGAGERGGEGLEVRGVAGLVTGGVFATQHAPGVLEVTDLREAEVEGEEDAYTEQKQRKVSSAAEVTVEKLDEGFKYLHRPFALLLCRLCASFLFFWKERPTQHVVDLVLLDHAAKCIGIGSARICRHIFAAVRLRRHGHGCGLEKFLVFRVSPR